jgi:hypothetical protein
LRELCLREHGVDDLLKRLQSQVPSYELLNGLIEFPVLVITRAAQVSGLFSRSQPNGILTNFRFGDISNRFGLACGNEMAPASMTKCSIMQSRRFVVT